MCGAGFQSLKSKILARLQILAPSPNMDLLRPAFDSLPGCTPPGHIKTLMSEPRRGVSKDLEGCRQLEGNVFAR